MSDELSLFPEGAPLLREVWKLYDRAKEFNSAISLEETVRMNENFFIGKQWEGVESNGLPTPQFNILKRIVGFTVAMVTTDNLHVSVTPMRRIPGTLFAPERILEHEFEVLMESCAIPTLLRGYARNAAVDGDGCLYTYWDAAAETPNGKGAIRTELLDNTCVFFGNPNDCRVQTQPYLIIARRESVRTLRRRARDAGSEDYLSIVPDGEENAAVDAAKRTDDKATVLLLLWRDEESGEICSVECTRSAIVRGRTELGIRLYPVCWLNWDYVKDCYHGQAMLTGLIPNQIFINKSWAMTMLSLMKSAFPKVLYDKTRIASWDNGVGRAIGVNGGDMSAVAKILDPAVVSPQISEYINLAVAQTEKCLGATQAAMGEGRPENTSAILALQRAAATPHELTKQNLYQSVEELFRIYLEFMGSYYGTRTVELETPAELRETAEFALVSCADTVELPFDFSCVRSHPFTLRLEVGASAYYSEIAAIETVDHLLQSGKISTLQYLERIPDDYIPAKSALMEELKREGRGEA